MNWRGLGIVTCRTFSVDWGRSCETHRWLVTENSSSFRTPVYTQKCSIDHPQEKGGWDLEKLKEMQLSTPSTHCPVHSPPCYPAPQRSTESSNMVTPHPLRRACTPLHSSALVAASHTPIPSPCHWAVSVLSLDIPDPVLQGLSTLWGTLMLWAYKKQAAFEEREREREREWC